MLKWTSESERLKNVLQTYSRPRAITLPLAAHARRGVKSTGEDGFPAVSSCIPQEIVQLPITQQGLVESHVELD